MAKIKVSLLQEAIPNISINKKRNIRGIFLKDLNEISFEEDVGHRPNKSVFGHISGLQLEEKQQAELACKLGKMLNRVLEEGRRQGFAYAKYLTDVNPFSDGHENMINIS